MLAWRRMAAFATRDALRSALGSTPWLRRHDDDACLLDVVNEVSGWL
jgi:hypothetical protein